VTELIDIDAVMNHPRRVQILRSALDRAHDGIAPLIDLTRPHVSGLETLPTDGRFLLVGNHTQFMGGEAPLASVREHTQQSLEAILSHLLAPGQTILFANSTRWRGPTHSRSPERADSS
jgi:hypothetical protein